MEDPSPLFPLRESTREGLFRGLTLFVPAYTHLSSLMNLSMNPIRIEPDPKAMDIPQFAALSPFL